MLLSAFSATIGSNYNKPELVEFQAAERFGCKSPLLLFVFPALRRFLSLDRGHNVLKWTAVLHKVFSSARQRKIRFKRSLSGPRQWGPPSSFRQV